MPFISRKEKQELVEFRAVKKHEQEEQAAREREAAEAAQQAADASKLQKAELRVFKLKPYRVFQFFSKKDASLLGSGLAYQAVFALFAALWFAFSVVGIVFAGDDRLQRLLADGVNSFVPGLIGGKGSAVSLDALLTPGVLGWSTAISLLTILVTAVGFLATLRTAILLMFGLPGPKTNFVVQKLKDLLFLLIFGALLLITVGISLVTTALTNVVFTALGLPTGSWVVSALSGLIGLVVVALVDSVILIGAVRVLAGVKITFKKLWRVAITGGIVLAFLQTVGSGLLGAPKANPLFASFAVIFGLLVYFNIVSQVILFCVSWLAVTNEDAEGASDRPVKS